MRVHRLGWFLLLVPLARNALFVRRTTASAYATVDAHNLVNIIATFAIAGFLANRWREVSRSIREGGLVVGCFILYYLACAMSGLWSPSAAYSTFRALESLAPFLLVLVLIRKSSDFFKAEFLVLMCMGLVVVIGVVGTVRSSGGFKTNSYSVPAGMLCAYSFAEVLSATQRRKLVLSAFAVLGTSGLALGSSTGSNFGVLGGVAVLLLISPRHMRYLLVLVCAMLLVRQENSVVFVLSGGKSAQQIATFHHRGAMWASCWDLFLTKPMLGHGFAIASRIYLHQTTAHNGYLGALLSVGVLGSAALFLGYAALLRDLLRCQRVRLPGSTGTVVAMVVSLINGMTVPVFGDIFSLQSVGFALMVALFTYHVKRRLDGSPHAAPYAFRHAPWHAGAGI